jgi:hypothetical protein
MPRLMPVGDPLALLVRRWIAADDIPLDWVVEVEAAEPDPAQAIRRLCSMVRSLVLARRVVTGEEEVIAAVVVESLSIDQPELVSAVEDVIIGLGGPPELAPLRVVQSDSNLLLAALVVSVVALASPFGDKALARIGLG